MSKLEWNKVGEKLFETGVEKGVLYPAVDAAYPKGYAWNGLTKVSENPTGAESTALYADDVKYLDIQSKEEFGATVEAYMCPPEFYACDGTASMVPGVMVTQQNRTMFGMSYKTLLGNDVKGTDYGYKLHLVYGAKAAVSQKDYGTVNENPNAMNLSWNITTTPVEVPGLKPTAHIIIDSTTVDAEKLKALEDILYGTESEEARLPLPTELATIFKGA